MVRNLIVLDEATYHPRVEFKLYHLRPEEFKGELGLPARK